METLTHTHTHTHTHTDIQRDRETDCHTHIQTCRHTVTDRDRCRHPQTATQTERKTSLLSHTHQQIDTDWYGLDYMLVRKKLNSRIQPSIHTHTGTSSYTATHEDRHQDSQCSHGPQLEALVNERWQWQYLVLWNITRESSHNACLCFLNEYDKLTYWMSQMTFAK